MYEVRAAFDDIGTLKVGARVSMAGVEIGRVASIHADAVEHRVMVSMQLNSRFDHIPRDSAASIDTQGLLGGQMVNLTNGGSDTYLRNDDRIDRTRSAISLEGMISQLFTHYLKQKSAPQEGGGTGAD
jgi:phospholipid/cholesterol/gamma-HCH transport system substrate-binding protein